MAGNFICRMEIEPGKESRCFTLRSSPLRIFATFARKSCTINLNFFSCNCVECFWNVGQIFQDTGFYTKRTDGVIVCLLFYLFFLGFFILLFLLFLPLLLIVLFYLFGFKALMRFKEASYGIKVHILLKASWFFFSRLQIVF